MDVEALYPEHATRLLAFLRARLPATIADEIHHDVWARAIEHEAELTGDDARRWLFRVAKNLVIDHQRKASTRRERGGLVGDYPGTADPLEAVEITELVARLRACVEKLPEHFKEVVKGRLEGESPQETADRLGIERGTVDKRFHTAKAQLKDCTGAEIR